MDRIKLQIEVMDRSQSEKMEIAVQVFELSQTLVDRWIAGDYRAKRQILDIICSNFGLDGVTLCYEMKKPFDYLAKGPFQKECGEGGIRTRGRRNTTYAALAMRCLQPLGHLS